MDRTAQTPTLCTLIFVGFYFVDFSYSRILFKFADAGVAHQDRTPQNEQGWGPTTSGLQSPNPPSAPALLRTCCCLHTIQHFFFLIFIHIMLCTHPPAFSTCTHAYYHTSPSGGTTIIPARSSPLFPPFCMYKVTLPCTLDHYSLKRALDWAETSEFLPLTSI